MFCRNCGKEMRDDAKFCPNCGTVNSASGSVGESAPRPQANPGSSAGASIPKKKRRGAGLVIGAGVAVVAVVGVLVVTVSGLFASPKGRVEKAIAKTMSAYSEIDKELGIPDLRALQEGKSVSGRASVELNSINSQLVGYDLSSLRGLGARVRTNYDHEARKIDAEMAAYWDSEDLVAIQMLFDDANLYVGSPQFTGDTFYGMNTETLGADLVEMTGDDSVEDVSFNVFDLIDIAVPEGQSEEMEKAVKAANKDLLAAVEVEKVGSETIDVNGKNTKTTEYHVVIPQEALEDYVDAMEDVMSAVDYVELYEDLLKATGMSRDDINYIMSNMGDMDVYGELADGIKDALDVLGDVELDVYLSGGYVSAVIYEESFYGTEVEIGLYLGGGSQYVDNLSLEIEIEEGMILIESEGNHTGKGGEFTDETTIQISEDGTSMGRLTSEMSYRPKEKEDNFQWEISVASYGSTLGSLMMEGQLTTTKDSLDLRLEDVSVQSAGIELFSIRVDYYIGPCEGMDVSVKSSKMIADMDELDVMELAYELQENAQEWTEDMQSLMAGKLSEELLWYLMYYGF